MPISTDQILIGLNPEQKKAVIHDTGPLLIIAGAGTGKTAAITKRIAYLIASKKCLPGEILALTFTDKAANEMESRVDVMVPYGYVDVLISTFHAFGDRVLREYALELGISSDYKVMSSAEQAVFFREHIFDFPFKYYKSLGDPTKHIQAILQVLSRAKDEDIEPEDYLKYVENTLRKGKKRQKSGEQGQQQEEEKEEAEKHLEIANVYKKYQELKLAKGKIDFGDQVNLALKLFREHPSILKKFQQKYKYILVDEFQDTNYAQFELVKLLAAKHKNIVVVGDDDQSIFKFRGAAISNILNFEKEYPKTKKIVLSLNYRSSQVILDSAYTLIQHNNPDRLEIKSNINKQLKAENGPSGAKPEYKCFDKYTAEADFAARTIKEKHESKKYLLKDFAILVRANKDAEPIIRSLNLLGIAHNFSGSSGLYSQPEVQLAVSFLRIIGDLSASNSLHELAKSQVYGLSALDLQKCSTYASRRNLTLYYVLSNLENNLPEFEPLSDIPQMSREIIKRIILDIEKYIEFAKDHKTGEVLYKFLKDSGMLKELTFSQTAESERKIKNLARFFEEVRKFSDVSECDRAHEFVKHLAILREAGDDPQCASPDPDQDAVNILTIHKSKGLEFKTVFMVGLASDKFPTRERRDPIELPDELVKKEILPSGDFHLQEERRLFYVGMTRAKEELYLTSAVDYGGKRERKTSRFVLEALGMPKLPENLLKINASAQINLFEAPLSANNKLSARAKKDGVLGLSYYHLDNYSSCPLRYKYQYVLNVPVLPSHTLAFGKALHSAVQAYGIAKMNKRKFSLKDLLDVFSKNWSPEGFISAEHEKQRMLSGQRCLEEFFNREEKKKDVPAYVEEPFTIVKDNIQLKGRIDQVDRVAGEDYIVDFKSSEVKKQEDADKRAKDSLQLALYSIAYQEIFKKLPKAVRLYFLDSGLIGEYEIGEKWLTKMWDKTLLIAGGIRAEDYKATPNYRACSYCPYSDICPDSAV